MEASRPLNDPPLFALESRTGPRVTLVAPSAHYAIHVFVLEHDVVRALHVASPPGLRGPPTWAIAPGLDDVPDTGRDRFDVTGFSLPPYECEPSADGTRLVLRTARLEATITLLGGHFSWRMWCANAWLPMARDRPTQAYNLGWYAPHRVCHYLVRDTRERYYGLGEKSGALDRAGRRLRMVATDAMGYDALTTDPLYKHIPFYITHRVDSTDVGDGDADDGTDADTINRGDADTFSHVDADTIADTIADTNMRAAPGDARGRVASMAFGLFYDTYAECVFDLGCERSNYHGPYRAFEADAGDLDYYVIAGPAVRDVVRRFTWLTGRPALLPRWALGYSGSTMAYTDAPDAQQQMAHFIEKCRQHDVLCDSFHLSSGYTSRGKRRYVFEWNRDKFPDPAAFVASYRAAGVRLCANIKPCLLNDHPSLADAHTRGVLICSSVTGAPAWSQWWDGVGAHVDFTCAAAQRWWREQIERALLRMGVAATWNDNNEYEISAPDARAHLFGAGGRAIDTRPLQGLLMMRCSRAAQMAHDTHARPMVVTRAGAAGMQRYAQTWSGDNVTAWRTLRWNTRMALGLALSGVSHSGHDVGGFAGPRPDAQLFVRWVEAGIFMARFSIHSWNDDGTANEPWMHDDDGVTTARVAALIRMRYRVVLPYLYALSWRYRDAYEPIARPTLYDYPHDPVCLDDCDDYMLGSDLLVATVMDRDVDARVVYLPRGAHWADYWSGDAYAGGQHVRVAAPLGRPPLFVRVGAALPLNVAALSFAHRGDTRAFALFAPLVGPVRGVSYEDDGETEGAYRCAAAAVPRWAVHVDAHPAQLVVRVRACGVPSPRGPLALLVRATDTRPLVTPLGHVLALHQHEPGWLRADVHCE